MSDFTICKNCKFWKIDDDQEVDGVHRCGAVIQLWGASEWDEEYDHRQIKKEFKSKKSFVQDGSDYKADLMTTENFGCNEFVEKLDF